MYLQVKDLYRSLVGDSFNEYRFFRSQFNSIEIYDENHTESTNECPICSEVYVQNCRHVMSTWILHMMSNCMILCLYRTNFKDHLYGKKDLFQMNSEETLYI